MTNRVKKVTGALFGILIFVSLSVSAQESAWYIGISGGQSTAHINKGKLDSSIKAGYELLGNTVTINSTIDNTDTALSIFAGYQINPYFALEYGYIELAKSHYDAAVTLVFPTPPTTVSGRITNDFESKGMTFAGIGSFPLGRVIDLHARVGLYFAQTDRESNTLNYIANRSSNSEDLFYSAGVGFKLGARWSLSVDYTTYQDVGDDKEGTGETDIDNISTSIVFRF